MGIIYVSTTKQFIKAALDNIICLTIHVSLHVHVGLIQNLSPQNDTDKLTAKFSHPTLNDCTLLDPTLISFKNNKLKASPVATLARPTCIYNCS